VLVTGFEPFGGLPANPSGDIALALAGPHVHAAILPVDFVGVRPALRKLLARNWDAVVLLGLSSDRSAFSLERVAINFRQATPDNRGRLPDRPEVVRGGPVGYLATLPLEKLHTRISDAGLPVEISLSAGAYLCNAAFYLARHALERAGSPCGFIHVPRTPELPGRGTPLQLHEQIRAIRIVLDVLLSQRGRPA